MIWPLLCLLFVPAQSKAQDSCRACDSTGMLPCKSCAKKDPCTGTIKALQCSVIAGCEACGGSGLRDCKRCDLDPLADAGETLKATQAWWAERKLVNEFMDKDLVQLESKHFVLVYDIKRISPTSKALKTHAGAHLYLDRLEAFRTEFDADLGTVEEDYYAKTVVMLWQNAKDQLRASREYTHQESTTESKLMGAKPVVSIHYDKSHLHEEFELHQAVVHQVAHCLLSNVFDGIWPGNRKGGWIDGGLAHAYEIRKFGGVRHYCYVEGDSMIDFKFGHWEPAVRIAVGKDKALPFLRVATKHTLEMTPEEHMFGWSFVDYVLRAHPGKLAQVTRAVKKKTPITEITQKTFGMTPFAFHAAWEAWVLETYSTKKKRKR